MSCAPYITIGTAGASPNLTVDEVIDGWSSYVANISPDGPKGLGNFLASSAAIASFWGIYFTGYEGGPDTVQGNNVGSALQAKSNASVDPRVTSIVTDYLRAWASYGPMMGTLNYYVIGAGTAITKYGIYSVLQDMAAPSTPKLAGIDAARNSVTPISPLIPFMPISTFNASFFVGHPLPPTPNGFLGWPNDVPYMFQSDLPIRVSLTLTISAADSTVNYTLPVTRGGVEQVTELLRCTRSGDWKKFIPCNNNVTFNVPAGVSVFRISKGRTWLGEITISLAPPLTPTPTNTADATARTIAITVTLTICALSIAVFIWIRRVRANNGKNGCGGRSTSKQRLFLSVAVSRKNIKREPVTINNPVFVIARSAASTLCSPPPPTSTVMTQ